MTDCYVIPLWVFLLSVYVFFLIFAFEGGKR